MITEKFIEHSAGLKLRACISATTLNLTRQAVFPLVDTGLSCFATISQITRNFRGTVEIVSPGEVSDVFTLDLPSIVCELNLGTDPYSKAT